MFSEKTLINCGGKLIDLSTPKVMGILNVTPDSFYPESRLMNETEALRLAEKMLLAGAAMLDVGGLSTRPGAPEISTDEELHRVIPAIRKIQKEFPDAVVSVDTYRSKVAEEAVAAGATMVNDISAGRLDDDFLTTVARIKVPYVLMHMQGIPQNMQENPSYVSAVNDVFYFLKTRLIQLNRLGIYDIIIDPGFGFGKSVEHNYQLLQHLSVLQTLGLPILAGLSRKSMICKVLHVNPGHALNGTTALHAVALLQGAKILRVHDVEEAVQTIELIAALQRS